MSTTAPALFCMSENAYAKVAQSVIRLIAFALIIVSFFLYATDLFLFLSHKPVPGPGVLALKGMPFLIGLILLAKSRALAERLTRDMD